MTERRIVLWPWQLPAGPAPGLRPVAVANPALETVWLTGGVPASPQDAHDFGDVIGFDLIVRVICSLEPGVRRDGFVATPRAVAGPGGHAGAGGLAGSTEVVGPMAIAIDHFPAADVDVSDPRLVVQRHGVGIRLPSISHLRRVRLDATGAFVAAGAVVLPDTGRFEVSGKEDPSVTWLDGTPWLSYVGVSGYGITPVLAQGRLVDGAWVYERVAEAQGQHDNRDVKILPVRPGGKLWRHDRVNTLPWGPKRMTWAASPDDGVSWSASLPLFEGQAAWERGHVGAGAVPFVATWQGREVLASYYHGVQPEPGAVAGCYQTGLALFDAADPAVELWRSAEPVLKAWDTAAFHAARQAAQPFDEARFGETHGLFVIPRVVFTTGHTRVGGRQYLFSGVNDFAIEIAELASIKTLY